jgi:hypothetical protein
MEWQTPGQTIDEAGAFACVTDKWDETEREKGHKLVDMAARCVTIPADPTAPKYTTDCVGKYEYMPDASWKGSGTCTWNLKGGDKVYEAFEEGSHLKEYLHRQIRSRQWRRHVHDREPDGHARRRQIQGPVGTALKSR